MLAAVLQAHCWVGFWEHTVIVACQDILYVIAQACPIVAAARIETRFYSIQAGLDDPETRVRPIS